jgi:hypothetical protein
VSAVYVIDDDCLLPRVRWRKGSFVKQTTATYVKFVKKNFGNETVLAFDGYSDDPSTKDVKHMRRCGKISTVAPNIKIEMQCATSFDQESFFGKR